MRGSTTRGCCRNGRHPCSSVGGPRQFFLSLLFFLLLITLLHHRPSPSSHHHPNIVDSAALSLPHGCITHANTHTQKHRHHAYTPTNGRSCMCNLTYIRRNSYRTRMSHASYVRTHLHTFSYLGTNTHTSTHTRREKPIRSTTSLAYFTLLLSSAGSELRVTHILTRHRTKSVWPATQPTTFSSHGVRASRQDYHHQQNHTTASNHSSDH